MLISAVCTLFEGHYHHGVAALTNSLCNKGFKGSIYAGYRGPLPGWAVEGQPDQSLDWPDSRTLRVTESVRLHFLPLATTHHLTNYKPDFMIRIWEGPAIMAEALFYFDPDIVIGVPWSSFEEWVGYGVTLCEDVNSPLLPYHPRRIKWRRYFESFGLNLNFKGSTYVNGGFAGVTRSTYSFLQMWKRVQTGMALDIGGLTHSQFDAASLPETARGPFASFGKTDQDALNATIEAWDGSISSIGKEGMAFIPGESVMSHALGKYKPWNSDPLVRAMSGYPPRLVDRHYWQCVDYPIRAHSSSLIFRRKIALKIASFIGRFYGRT